LINGQARSSCNPLSQKKSKARLHPAVNEST
jgi:hypothetical protein